MCRARVLATSLLSNSKARFGVSDLTHLVSLMAKAVRDVRMGKMMNRRAVLGLGTRAIMGILSTPRRAEANSTVQSRNKSIVARWYAEFWGKTYSPAVIDEVTSPETTLKHSLHRALIGPNALRSFMAEFRSAFPDLGFELTTPLLADGDRVIAQWVGGGTHTGQAFNGFVVGPLSAASGRTMHFAGISIFRLKDGKIIEENGLDDEITALLQLDLLDRARLDDESITSICAKYC
jgi:predicted ester cyclase